MTNKNASPPPITQANDLLGLTPLELCEHFQIRFDEHRGRLLADTPLLEQLRVGELSGFSARLYSARDDIYYFGANNFDGVVEMQLGREGDIPTLYGVG